MHAVGWMTSKTRATMIESQRTSLSPSRGTMETSDDMQRSAWVRRSPYGLVAGLVLLMGLSLGATGWAATIAEIARNPAVFDNQTVTVSGTASETNSRTSRRGNPYTTFRLADQGDAVKVFTFGTPAIKDGQRVEVHGVFQRVKQVGRYTFHDEIDASSVTPTK